MHVTQAMIAAARDAERDCYDRLHGAKAPYVGSPDNVIRAMLQAAMSAMPPSEQEFFADRSSPETTQRV